MSERMQRVSQQIDEIAEAIVLGDGNDPESLGHIRSLLVRLAADTGLPSDLCGALEASSRIADYAEMLSAAADCVARAQLHLRTMRDEDGACELAEELGETASATASEQPREAEAAADDDALPQVVATQPEPGPAAVNPLAEDMELLGDFVTRSTELIETAESALMALERNTADSGALDEVFRALHTIKGMSGFLSLDEIQSSAHTAEDVLAEARRSARVLRAEEIDDLFSTVDSLKRLVAEVLGPSEPVAPDEAAAASTSATSSVAQSVRVDAERLDALLDAIGELVIAETMVLRAPELAGGVSEKLSSNLAHLDKITRGLQEMAMSLRMVSLRGTFLRMSRAVRDLGQKSGKPVRLVTTGEDTEIDKSMVEQLADPLLHLIRNAVDHGIESPAEREAAGKPAEGVVELHAYHKGGAVHIEVRDDGRGLDRDRVRAKAVERGLVVEGESGISDRELLALITTPGFSTAGQVTAVSGRGVGMDVVRRMVESLRGQLDLATETGRGATFTMRLPLTLAIIDGMVLRVGSERYVLPTLSVVRSVRPAPGQVRSVLGQGEMLPLADGLVRVLRLAGVLDVRDACAEPSEAILTIVEDEGGQVAVMADELVGRQQVVIKSLEGIDQGRGLAGACIMPDGTAGLILDVAGLLRLTDATTRARGPSDA